MNISMPESREQLPAWLRALAATLTAVAGFLEADEGGGGEDDGPAPCPDPSTLPRAIRYPDGTCESYGAWAHDNSVPEHCDLRADATLIPPTLDGETFDAWRDAVNAAGWSLA